MARLLATAILLVRASAAAAEEAHAHGEHGEHPWEWTGAFDLSAQQVYTWSAARSAAGAYAAPSMLLAVVAGGDAEAAEAAAEALFEGPAGAWRNVTAGSKVVLSGTSGVRLLFDQGSWISLFRLQPAASATVRFFGQHAPAEFERGGHFLKDAQGADVGAPPQEPLSSTVGGLGLAVGGAAISAVPGLAVVALVGPALARLSPGVFPALDALSAGAIFAAAAFLLLPEALYLASSGHTESVGAATWGVAIMAGWLVGVITHQISQYFLNDTNAVVPIVVDEAGGTECNLAQKRWDLSRKVSSTERAVDMPVAAVVLVGDCWHNLVDGMVIGFSAKMCSSSAFWGVVAATLAHEFPQEVADFLILISRAGMHWGWATVLNASTAFLSVIFGAIIAHQAEVHSNWQGICLAFGGGVYLFVAATELSPSLVELGDGRASLASAARLGMFAVGAACIGLVLIDHAHCSAEGLADGAAAMDAHAGHGH